MIESNVNRTSASQIDVRIPVSGCWGLEWLTPLVEKEDEWEEGDLVKF